MITKVGGGSSLELEQGGGMDCSDIYWGIPDKDTKQPSAPTIDFSLAFC